MKWPAVMMGAALGLLLVGFNFRPNTDASIDRICIIYGEALAKFPGDHAGAKAHVNEKREEILDHKVKSAFTWDAEVLRSWVAIEVADASERYRLFQGLVKDMADRSDWSCPAMELFYRAEIVAPPPVEPEPQDAAPSAPSSTGETGNGKPIIMGSLDKDLIRDVIKKHTAQVRYCYEKRLIENPGLSGNVKVEFIISASGSVDSAKVSEATIDDAEMKRCILAQVKTMVFPKPKGGGIVIVKYPFVFKTR